MIKLCPFRTLTNKVTVKEGLKVSTQDFDKCVLEKCAAYESEHCVCIRTGQRVIKEED